MDNLSYSSVIEKTREIHGKTCVLCPGVVMCFAKKRMGGGRTFGIYCVLSGFGRRLDK